MNRQPHSVLDQLCPDATQVVHCSQWRQKSHHDSHAHSQVFAIDSPVMDRNFAESQSPPWLQGKVIACTGRLLYKVCLTNGCIICRHTDHLQHTARHLTMVQTDSDSRDNVPLSFPDPNPQRPIEQEDHQGALPQRSQRTDDPRTDTLHNE